MSRLIAVCCLALLTLNASFADTASSFFDDRAVREIRITFEDANWYNTLFQAHSRNPEDPYFPARFEYGDTVIPRVGVRFKGNSSFQRNGVKKPFKIDFNEYDDDATFLGLKKLNLNNGDLQPDFMREKLLHDMAGKYVAALRSVYVRLYVNGAYYGLYLAVEQPDKVMMQSRYGSDEDGNLYEAEEQMGASRPNLAWLGSNPSAYQTIYLLKTNESANDYSGLIRFLDILNNTASTELPARLETICDVENWMTWMAANNLAVNLDSYLGVGAEYYLYHRSSDGRFVHIQWDHNETFGITGDGTPRIANPFTTDPFYLPTAGTGQPGGGGAASTSRPLLTRMWAVDEYKRIYLRALARFLRSGFDPASMQARTQQLADLIRTDVYADPNKPYTNAQFETAINSQVGNIPGVNQFVSQRYAYLRPLLDGYAQPSDVRLNELATGDAAPWVEVHNLGPGPVTLSNLYLSDDAAAPTKWQLPARTLADGEFLVIWLDGETSASDTHSTIKPSAAGGKLFLFVKDTDSPADTLTYGAISAGQSMVRTGLFGSTWELSGSPTPGEENTVTAAPAPVNPSAGTGQLLINEVMADNDGSVPDPDEAGAYEDWFEVYNPGTAAIDMGGMYLTDNLSNTTKFKIPAGVTIPAKGYLVFYADSETSQGARHASFSLSADGEVVALYAADGTTLIDSVTFGVQQTDVAIGRVTDGAATWTIFKPPTPGASNALAYASWITNAASYIVSPAAPSAIASAFGSSLAASTVVASSTPLPTTLGGVTVSIKDSANATHPAPLYFVSEGQVNFQVPAETAAGRAAVTLRKSDGGTVAGDLLVETIAPGLFSANATGAGVGLIAAVRVDSAGTQTVVPVYQYDATQQKIVPVAISLGAATDQVYLVIYATGVRGAKDVTAEVGGQEVAVTYAGAQSEYAGLDQINVGPLPRALAGKGEVDVVVEVDGHRMNRVTVKIE